MAKNRASSSIHKVYFVRSGLPQPPLFLPGEMDAPVFHLANADASWGHPHHMHEHQYGQYPCPCQAKLKQFSKMAARACLEPFKAVLEPELCTYPRLLPDPDVHREGTDRVIRQHEARRLVLLTRWVPLAACPPVFCAQRIRFPSAVT